MEKNMQLTPKQQEVYDYICKYIDEKAFPPTVREIASALGLRSPGTVHRHITALIQKGYIKNNPSSQRTISLCQTEAKNTVNSNSSIMCLVPKVGTVAAGKPIFAFDDPCIMENLPLPSFLLHGAGEGEVFLLDIKGESMIEAGINHGDMIVVHRGIKAENGDIVVAMVNEDTATVKRVFFETDRVRLQPENSGMEPIYAGYDEVQIIGKVISLLRKY